MTMKPFDIQKQEKAKNMKNRKIQNESVWYSDGSKIKTTHELGFTMRIQGGGFV